MKKRFNLGVVATLGALALAPAIASAEPAHGSHAPGLGGSYQGTGIVQSVTGTGCTAVAGDTYSGTLVGRGHHKVWATFEQIQQTGATPPGLQVFETTFTVTSGTKASFAGTATSGVAGSTSPTSTPFTATLTENDALSFSVTVTFTGSTCTEVDQIEFLGKE